MTKALERDFQTVSRTMSGEREKVEPKRDGADRQKRDDLDARSTRYKAVKHRDRQENRADRMRRWGNHDVPTR